MKICGCLVNLELTSLIPNKITKQSIIQMFPKGNIYTLHPKED